MKITVTESMFLEEFRNSSRADQFSRAALIAIFNHIEECERDLPPDEGSDIELDIIQICCEYVEVDNKDTEEMENYLNCEGGVVAELEFTTVFITM